MKRMRRADVVFVVCAIALATGCGARQSGALAPIAQRETTSNVTASANASAPSWLTMGYDEQRTGYNPTEHTLGVSNVGGIHALWTTSIGGEIGEPVYVSSVSVKNVKTSVLYATSGSGQAVAINAGTGAILWRHQMSTVSYKCGTGTYSFGANGTPVIDRSTNRIYATDGAANVHALNMSTGAEIAGWPVNIATPANHNFIYSALTYNHANHTLYAETSSTCEISPWYGRITAIDPATPAITNTFFVAQGASGGGIWGFGGASVDPSTNDVYIATGNGDTHNGGSQTAGYSEQVVALSPDLGTVLGHYYAKLPPGHDSDFGATPLLFQPPGCPLLAAAVNKTGLFVLYKASDISAGPVQTIDMSINSDNGDFIGNPSYDPLTNFVYIGLPATFGIYKPGMGAFSVGSNCTLNPTPVWNAVFGADGAKLTGDDTFRSPISIANGVAYVSDYDTGVAYAFNASTGAELWSHTLSGKGVVGPIVISGRLYTSDITGKITAWSP
ncbi:MAG TPA: PQQ-binding-like beta-propeller repeat protein [Candidatus Baltobacteraceae bacterium]|nr:PQQ-binding-like beta-propeller repeat protein [Candidatus Baltobacteraceae bacterium]